MPAWVRERRQPTRAELVGRHVADGGTEYYGVSASAASNAFFSESPAETELVPVGDTGTFVRQPKVAPAAASIKVKRYNT